MGCEARRWDEAYLATLPPIFPWGWGAGARVGAMLKWPLGLGPVSPFAGVQVGVLGVAVAGAGADGGKASVGGRELRTEVGVDIPLAKRQRPGTSRPTQLFLSASGGSSKVTWGDALGDTRSWFGRLAIGAAM
jgi:hypothetical protein